MIRFVLLIMIRFYRTFVSPMKGPCCRFVPTCSEYTLEAIQVYGPLKGLALGAWRLARCHPFHPGGYDSVGQPSKHSHSV
ncbi:MAG: membrane protein insertion efficiency factor YidD [Syntrophobacteraceae bacterium]